jgi:hypothetical protein
MDLKQLKKLINEEVDKLNNLKAQDLKPDDKTSSGIVGRKRQQPPPPKSPETILDPDTGERLLPAFDEEGFPVDIEDYSKQEDYTRQINQLLDQPDFVKYLLANPRASQLFREKFKTEKK